MTPIPFSEPPYLAGLPSPYYSPSHLLWQKACRAFLDENLTPHALDWEREQAVPPDVFQKFSAANMLIPCLPSPLPVEWLKKLGVHSILGVVDVEDWDYIHTYIYCDEVSNSWNSYLHLPELTYETDVTIWSCRTLSFTNYWHGVWSPSNTQVW